MTIHMQITNSINVLRFYILLWIHYFHYIIEDIRQTHFSNQKCVKMC